MGEVILHIGMHKTGTTSIQKALSGYDDGTTRMARLKYDNHSISMTTIFSEDRYSYHHHKDAGRPQADVDVLRKSLVNQLDNELRLERPRLIISGEGMCLLDAMAVSEIKQHLQRYVDRVRVIAYVRDPAGFSSSVLQQYIQGGMKHFHIPPANYRARFENYLNVFGAEHVHFVPYKTREMQGQSVVSDFCSRVSIDASDITVVPRENTSTSCDVINLLYHFNRNGVESQGSECLQRSRTEFIALLKDQLPGNGYRFSQSQVLSSGASEDIHWMESVSGLRLLDDQDPCSQEKDICTVIERVDSALVKKLQLITANVDPHIARSSSPTLLLNFLFHSIYFRNKHISMLDDAPDIPTKLIRLAARIESGKVFRISDVRTLLKTLILWRPRMKSSISSRLKSSISFSAIKHVMKSRRSTSRR